MRTTGIHQLMHTKFDRMKFEGEMLSLMGMPSWDFSCLIYGNSGNGKTTLITRLVKYLCSFDLRTCYISHEEGIGATMQDAFAFANMMEVSGGVILAEDTSFDEMVTYFSKRGSPEVMVIDSIDYCNLTKEQYKILRERFKKKIIIMISWSDGSKPKCQAAKDIEYMADIKLFVKDFMVWPKSRFGGNEPQPIWEERARLLNQKWFEDRDKKRAQAAAAEKKLCTQVAIEPTPTAVNVLEKPAETAKNTNEERGVSAHD